MNKNTCILGEQDYMFSCSTRIHVFLFNKNTCILVQQEYMYPCRTWFSVQQEHMYSCSTRIHLILFLFNKTTCVLVEKEYMYSCWARRHVFLLNKNTCTLVEQEQPIQSATRQPPTIRSLQHKAARVPWISEALQGAASGPISCWTRTYVFLFNKHTCILVQQEYKYSCWTRPANPASSPSATNHQVTTT